MNTETQVPSRAPLARVEPWRARAGILAALGDPVRLAVVDSLALGDRCPDALAAALDIPGNLLAHHVTVLVRGGIVERRRSAGDRRRTYLVLRPEALTGLLPGQVDGDAAVAPPRPDRLLFVCTENSARSVLAEALWQRASALPVASAGTRPASRVNPHARAAARRASLPPLARRPRALAAVRATGDLVVSVCDAAHEALGPTATAHLHWPIPDPARLGTAAAFDDAVRELDQRVSRLAAALPDRGPTASPTTPPTASPTAPPTTSHHRPTRQ